MKLTVGTTLKAGGETVFWLSLMKAMRAGLVGDFKLTEGDTPVGRSRNNLTRDFLKSDSDALLWIDSDIEFDPYHIECLLEHDKPIVAGIYPLKRRELAWCINTAANSPMDSAGPLHEVKYVGTGFMLIRREVFLRIAQAYPELRYIEDAKDRQQMFNYWRMEVGLDTDLGINRWLSEDWWFCEMWRRIGGKVFVDKRVTLKHHGMIAYPIDQSVLVPIPDRAAEAVDMNVPENMRPGIKQIMDGEYDVPNLGDDAIKTVLDIGANIGGFTLWANKRWPKAFIHCYEPGSDNLKLWEENCKGINGLAAVTHAAITNKTGPVRLYHGTANGFLHSLKDIGFQRKDDFEDVPAIAPANLPKADFIKIDTEGSEVDILMGLDVSDTIALAVEWHGKDDREEIPRMLCAKGFNMTEDVQHGPYYGVQKFVSQKHLAKLSARTATPDSSGKPGPPTNASGVVPPSTPPAHDISPTQETAHDILPAGAKNGEGEGSRPVWEGDRIPRAADERLALQV